MSDNKRPTVAILGASANRDKFGNKSVRAHLRAGYEVYPVNPKEAEIEGLKCYASVAQIPVPVDRISIYLSPAIALQVLPEIALARPKEVWLNPGSESPPFVERAAQLGLHVIQACSIVDVGFSPSQFAASGAT